MAIIMFKCPFCGKKVETPEDNVGREGLCPGCQKIFEVPEPGKKETARAARPTASAGFLASGEPEYKELGAIIGAAIVALGLAAIAGTTTFLWVAPWAGSAQAVAIEKNYIIFGSAACAVFMVVSAATRKSLVPAVLTGAGWGMFALVWLGTIWRTLEKAAHANSAKSDVSSGLYLAMLAGLIAIAGAVFFYYQVRDSGVMGRLGLFLVATQVVALAMALVLAQHHLKPALAASQAAPPAVQKPAPTPPAPAQPPTGGRSGGQRSGR